MMKGMNQRNHASVAMTWFRHPNPRRQGILFLAMIWIGGGCANKPVRLWPVLDVTPGRMAAPAVSDRRNSEKTDQGRRVRALWPIFELDTTGSAAKHALRPIYSYDGETKEGSVVWPIVRFGFESDDDRYFQLLPLYFKGRKDGNSWHALIPLAGALKHEHAGNWLFLFPYIDMEKGRRYLRGALAPPLLFGGDAANDSNWRLILNYFHSEKPGTSIQAFAPFFAKSSHLRESSPANPESGPVPERSRELFVLPFYYHRTVEKESRRLESEFFLGPLYQRSWGADYEKRSFGLVPWLDFDGLFVTSLLGWSSKERNGTQNKTTEIFPFFSRDVEGPNHKHALPGLGLSWWNHKTPHLGVSGPNRGWAWWPIVGSTRGWEEGSREPNERFGWRGLAGLIRRSKDGSRRNLSLLFPLHDVSETRTMKHHRLWPLYRYTARETKTDFSALAEIVSIRKSSEWKSDLLFLLHPISYQSAESGDYDFRLFWKLLEVRSVQGESTKALNPIFHHFAGPDQSLSLFLGGLFGWGHDGDERFTRAFWFFDF